MKLLTLSLVCLEIGKDSAPQAEACLAEMQAAWHYASVARSVVGRETSGLVSILRPNAIEEDPLVILSVLVPTDQTNSVAAYLVKRLGLSVPGQGSLLVIPVQVGVPDGFDDSQYRLSVPAEDEGEHGVILLGGVAQIISIVQRGEGTNMATAALNLGQSVPSVSFGYGMGLREKLNLIRITFPRDKEIVRLIVNTEESEEGFNNLVDAGKLDQPGKGFIYLSPIELALPNTLLFRGTQRHAATMEQVIQAIDTIQGGATWRRKRIGESATAGTKRTYLRGMMEITARIQDAYGHELVLSAMAAGSAGATIGKCRFARRTDAGKESVGMEELYMIVPEAAAPKILEALEAAGLFHPERNGSVMMRPVTQACTYLGR